MGGLLSTKAGNSVKMKNYFQGKVAWVTGASSGLGREIAICLSGLGCKVILSARNTDALGSVKQECQNAYGFHKNGSSTDNVVSILPLDLAKFNKSEKGFKTEAEKAHSFFSQIDFLINNAGKNI